MKKSILAIAFLSASVIAEAKVVLPQFITDSMVVQQKSVLTIPGTTKAGTAVKVTTSWNNKTYQATADANGKFTVQVSTPKAGGPYKITFDDGDVTVLNDILSGEVWMCSGQSNMEMPIMGWGHVMNCEQERANAKYPNIRLLQIARVTSYKPEGDTKVNMGGWRRCAPETVDNFSALAYFYARELHKKLNVPIGVIDCSWGGTPAESWTSFAGVKEVGGFEKYTTMFEGNKFEAKAIESIYNSAQENAQRNINAAVAEANSNILAPISDKTMRVPQRWEETVLPDFDGTVLCQKIFRVPDELMGRAQMRRNLRIPVRQLELQSSRQPCKPPSKPHRAIRSHCALQRNASSLPRNANKRRYLVPRLCQRGTRRPVFRTFQTHDYRLAQTVGIRHAFLLRATGRIPQARTPATAIRLGSTAPGTGRCPCITQNRHGNGNRHRQPNRHTPKEQTGSRTPPRAAIA